jgi:hypothetical protein
MIAHLSDGTLSTLVASQCGEARQLDDGQWLPLVMRSGKWTDAPTPEPSWPHRLEAMKRSRELAD